MQELYSHGELELVRPVFQLIMGIILISAWFKAAGKVTLFRKSLFQTDFHTIRNILEDDSLIWLILIYNF